MKTHHGCVRVPAYGGGALAERECGAHGRSESAVKRRRPPAARRFIYSRGGRARKRGIRTSMQVRLTRHVCLSVWRHSGSGFTLGARGGPRGSMVSKRATFARARGLAGELHRQSEDPIYETTSSPVQLDPTMALTATLLQNLGEPGPILSCPELLFLGQCPEIY